MRSEAELEEIGDAKDGVMPGPTEEEHGAETDRGPVSNAETDTSRGTASEESKYVNRLSEESESGVDKGKGTAHVELTESVKTDEHGKAENHKTPNAKVSLEDEETRGEHLDAMEKIEAKSEQTLPGFEGAPLSRMKKVKATQMSLLEGQQTTSDKSQVLTTAYLLTNRGNLLEILSTGLIKPMVSYGKYYSDIGVLCPQEIVLLGRQPCTDLVDQLTEDPEMQFPVLVSLDLNALEGAVRTVDVAFESREVQAPPDKNALALVVPGVIPADLILEVHFRSEQEREEFCLRRYANVAEDIVQMHVSPHMFDGPAIDVASLMTAVRNWCDDQRDQDSTIWRRADALGGAALMLTGLANRNNSVPLADVQTFLDILTGRVNVTESRHHAASDSLLGRYFGLLPDLLVGESTEPEWDSVERIKASISYCTEADSNDEQLVEAMMLLATIVYLVGSTPEEQTYEETIEAIRHRVNLWLPVITTRGVEEPKAISQHILESVRAVLDLEEGVSEFQASDSALARGLLQFFLQPQPKDVTEPVHERLVKNGDSLALAALFSGVLFGRGRIPSQSRPGREVEVFVDRQLARRINRYLGGANWQSREHPPVIHTQTAECGRIEILAVNGHIVIHRQCHLKLSAQPGQGVPQKDHVPQPETEAQRRNERNFALYAKVRRRLLKSELVDRTERDAALFLCQEAGWYDCLTTIIPLDGRAFFLTNYEGGLQLRLKGELGKETKVEVRAQEFKRHLNPDEWDQLPDRTRNEVARILGLEP